MPKIQNTEQEVSRRSKILDAAEQMFSEKGYDGARTSEIAKLAGVNSALLYYYYDSKEDILNELMGRAIRETVIVLENNFLKFTHVEENIIDNFILETIEFLEKKHQILKIMFIELLKSGSDNYSVFELLDPIYQKVRDKVSELGGQIDDKDLFLSQMFFVFTTPILMQVTVGDKWSKFNNISVDKTRSMMFQIFKQLISGMIFKSL